jgi:hypothetical protein
MIFIIAYFRMEINQTRTQEFPKYGGETFKRSGKVRKPIRDNHFRSVLVYRYRRWQPVRELGLDGVYPIGKCRKRPLHIAVDLDTGQPVAIG